MFAYMKTIKQHLPEIEKYFFENEAKFPYTITSIKIDSIYRIYTVLNFPEKTTKNIQKYGHVFLDNETHKFIFEFNKQLKKLGLFELVGLSRADKIGENNILIVVEFKLLNIGKVFRNSILFILGLIGAGSLFFI
jgi:hypothetical protein